MLLDLAANIPGFNRLTDNLKTKGRHGVAGLDGAARAFFLASVYRQVDGAMIVVAHSADDADRLANELSGWNDRVYKFPQRELLLTDVAAQSPDSISHRLTVLQKLCREEKCVIVTNAGALLNPVPAKAVMNKSLLNLSVGKEISMEQLLNDLIQMGYEHAPVADGRGRFARRGGILDVWDFCHERGYRFDFFGDTLESVRLFDPESQRTIETVGHVTVGPATELVLTGDRRRELIDRIIDQARKHQKLESIVDRLENWDTAGLASLLPLIEPSSSLLDYVAKETCIVLNSPKRMVSAIQGAYDDIREQFESYFKQGLVVSGQADIVTPDEIAQKLEQCRGLDIYGIEGASTWPRVGSLMTTRTRRVPSFFGRWDMFCQELDVWHSQDLQVVIVTASVERADRIRSALAENDVSARVREKLSKPQAGVVTVTTGDVSNGFIVHDANLVIISEADILGRVKKPVHRPHKKGRPIRAARDLKPGDYVVHLHHGIGKYLGLTTLAMESSKRDYLFIRYAGEDRLYVPTDQLELVQKYVGGEGSSPRLNRLGGMEWQRTQKRVKAAVKEMAAELIQLYAKRQALPGRSFTGDPAMEREFADLFPYTETPDQKRAIDDALADLESNHVMERLLCGDVGYGKTEVALRAACRVILSGKQVAMLVPTTVLAHQHYRTCKQRFAHLPVNIDMLSRFRTPAEQKSVLKRVFAGAVDLLIGTHRLLQQDLKFNDPGLIIIDEEHRFGVAHKERLKQTYPDVDVLVLTATPIPRTLHMSLTGLRDMSLMETPPENRYPVQTYVVGYSPDMLAEALRRERNRGGQVYYVHNRVETMDIVHSKVAELVPEASIGIAHGQMKEEELQRVMLGFLDGGYDVLLSTTIIESGLDIPNVNTLIVENADKMGLAQLYQLRGRVGRSDRLAYAYFTFRSDRVLSEVAEKRLSAIREFTELGSGFKLAVRDLEIRGAGNLLGPEQHGFMMAVGFDMYCRLLEHALSELKGEQKPVEQPPVKIELGIDAYLSDEYVSHPGLKIEFYQRLATADVSADVSDIKAELTDRFGPLPEPAQNLIKTGYVRVACKNMGISSVSVQRGMIRFQFARDDIEPDKIVDWAQSLPYRIRIGQGDEAVVRVSTGKKQVTIDDIGHLVNAWDRSDATDGHTGE